MVTMKLGTFMADCPSCWRNFIHDLVETYEREFGAGSWTNATASGPTSALKFNYVHDSLKRYDAEWVRDVVVFNDDSLYNFFELTWG